MTAEPQQLNEAGVATRRMNLGLAFLLSWASTLALLRRGNLGDFFRNSIPDFFSFDQLAYATIAANAANGDLTSSEPFTQTGHSYYPSAWYKAIGLVSWLTDIPVLVAWSTLGILLVLLTVSVAGWVGYKASGIVWAPILPALLLWTGPLALAVSESWYLTFDSHAVIWGPYAVLFPLNAETAGISLGTLGLLGVYAASRSPQDSRLAKPVLLMSSLLLVGMTANIQTYAFMTVTVILACWLVSLQITGASSISRRIVLVVPALAVLLLSPILRSLVGALVVFALLVMALVAPSLIATFRANPKLALGASIAFGVGATPQIFNTALGYLRDDPFLSYRTEQSADLGVPVSGWILGSLAMVLVGLWIWQKVGVRSIEGSLLFSLLFANILLSFNEYWGFEQEPYRFWIQTFAISAILLGPLLAVALRSSVSQKGPLDRTLLVTAFCLLAITTWNVGGFRSDIEASGSIDLTTPRYEALAEAGRYTDGQVAAEPCLHPGLVKLTTGRPVGAYNMGIAWPQRKSDIDAFSGQLALGTFDSASFRASGGQFFITDSACGTEWNLDEIMGTLQTASIPYDLDGVKQEIRVWEVYD